MSEIEASFFAQASILSELASGSILSTLRKLNITYAVFELLTAVQGAGSNAPQAEVARRLGITPPTLSEAVVSSVKNGLLIQEPHPTDSRSKILRLTPKAEAAIARVLKDVRSIEQSVLRDIPGHDLAVAMDVLKKANGILAKYAFSSENEGTETL